MPIDGVGTVSVFVDDQDRAKKYYTEVLGFELRTGEPLFPLGKHERKTLFDA